jgi:hypothetical protein
MGEILGVVIPFFILVGIGFWMEQRDYNRAARRNERTDTYREFFNE